MSLKSKAIIKTLKNDYQLYLIILLPVIWLIMFRYIPMYGIQIAFKKFMWSEGIWGSPWVGFANFERFFDSYLFWRLIWNTLGISFYELAVGFPIPILLALALNATLREKFKKVVQFVIYMPHFISTVVMVGIILQFLNPKTGLINAAMQPFGLEELDFIGVPEYFKSIFVWSGIWQNAGWGTIIYLATLASVDQSLHEAATIDGASRFQRILHIDIPCILPTMVILLILQAGQIMNVGFEKVLLMQNPLNLASSEVISTYVYKIGLASSAADFSFSTTIGLFNSLVSFILLLTVNQAAKRMNQTSLW
ncbi:sugar ABC transporter permease [Paenibacillus sp. F411]|uniref:ABC transporter permease n=1 Tax=Paenibacillus sp. F411 TaxID=2820239 RepID=UPI001AAE2131|nr:ABC transporter permease subunit [Paenibacillus sp. F411]MBO2944882.1 sugar ABC transporter permease [Paenibacillus sp. F411]